MHQCHFVQTDWLSPQWPSCRLYYLKEIYGWGSHVVKQELWPPGWEASEGKNINIMAQGEMKLIGSSKKEERRECTDVSYTASNVCISSLMEPPNMLRWRWCFFSLVFLNICFFSAHLAHILCVTIQIYTYIAFAHKRYSHKIHDPRGQRNECQIRA